MKLQQNSADHYRISTAKWSRSPGCCNRVMHLEYEPQEVIVLKTCNTNNCKWDI